MYSKYCIFKHRRKKIVIRIPTIKKPDATLYAALHTLWCSLERWAIIENPPPLSFTSLGCTTELAFSLVGKPIWDIVYRDVAKVAEDAIVPRQVINLLRTAMWEIASSLGVPTAETRRAAEQQLVEQVAKRRRQ